MLFTRLVFASGLMALWKRKVTGGGISRMYTAFFKFIDFSGRRLHLPETFSLRGREIKVEQNKIRTNHDVMGKPREKLPSI